MSNQKADIIAQLKRDILPLQGFRTSLKAIELDRALGPITSAFPNSTFPLGAIHEFISTSSEDSAASSGFLSGIVSNLMVAGRVLIWISSSRTIFPPALKKFGIDPGRIMFIDLSKEKDVLWAMEESLKCEGLAAVVGEMKELNFTSSRRLQLAVEKSRVTGFVLRRNPRSLNTTACVTRWKISALSSGSEDDLPGIGFPRWNVELLKVRNGVPGKWEVEWRNGNLNHYYKLASIREELRKKTG